MGNKKPLRDGGTLKAGDGSPKRPAAHFFSAA